MLRNMFYIFKKITKPYYLSGKKHYCPVCEITWDHLGHWEFFLCFGIFAIFMYQFGRKKIFYAQYVIQEIDF